MKKNIIVACLVCFSVMSACNKNKPDALGAKKTKLAELKGQQSELNKEISELQEELNKLQPFQVEKSSKVAVRPIAPGSIDHFIEITGRVEAENNQYISAQASGAITRLFVKEGDYVSKGQKIATIDNSLIRSSIQEIVVQLETARTVYEKQKALWDQKIGTEIQLIQARTNVESLEKRIATLKAQDAYSSVISPVSGYVDEVRLRAGELASPGLGIVRVINFNDLKVTANLPDVYAGTVSKGDLVNIFFPELNKSAQARLHFVSQTINPLTRSFIIQARIPKFDKDLKPNLTAEMKINDQSKGGALVVSENMVLNTEQGKVVMVAEGAGKSGVARARKVATGISYNGQIEVVSGLNTGDLIITEGFQEVTDGQAIEF